MRIVPGRVVGGVVVVDPGSLAEGAVVTVLAHEDDETLVLSDAEEAELLDCIARAERGDVVPAADTLERLRRRG